MRAKKPKASIIVITKNEEKNIENCLKSIKNQTFQDFEIIVSDAESKDKTVKIAEKYADNIIVKKTNRSAGRNLGVSFAKGKILVFLDADTVLLPDTLEKVLEAFKEKNVIGATCPTLPMNADPKYVGIYMFYNGFSKASIKIGRPQIAGFFCAYKKKAFDEIKGFDDEVGILEDYNLSQRISKIGKIKFVNSALVLTSHRRLKEWGIRTSDRYISAWIKMQTTGKSFSEKWYRSVK